MFKKRKVEARWGHTATCPACPERSARRGESRMLLRGAPFASRMLLRDRMGEGLLCPRKRRSKLEFRAVCVPTILVGKPDAFCRGRRAQRHLARPP